MLHERWWLSQPVSRRLRPPKESCGDPRKVVCGCDFGGVHDAARAQCGDLAVWPYKAGATAARGGTWLGFLSLVCDTLELNYYTKVFHPTVHALRASSCKMRRYPNVVCCSLKIPPSKLSHEYSSLIAPSRLPLEQRGGICATRTPHATFPTSLPVRGYTPKGEITQWA